MLSMLIFGSVGLFRRAIPLSSGLIAFSRGAMGALFLLLFILFTKKPEFSSLGKSLPRMILSGALMGINWMLLFEAYNYTSVAAATLCYYTAPLMVIAASPFFFGEKTGGRKLFGVFLAAAGMIPVSGISGAGFEPDELKGIFLALGAAVLYASVVIMNKKDSGAPPLERTAVQLFSAAAVMIPYLVFTGENSFPEAETSGILLLAVMGLLHTGLAYALYFSALGKVRARTAAVLSYIDPVTAVLLSAFVLGEELSAGMISGAFMILGGAFLSESAEE